MLLLSKLKSGGVQKRRSWSRCPQLRDLLPQVLTPSATAASPTWSPRSKRPTLAARVRSTTSGIDRRAALPPSPLRPTSSLSRRPLPPLAPSPDTAEWSDAASSIPSSRAGGHEAIGAGTACPATTARCGPSSTSRPRPEGAAEGRRGRERSSAPTLVPPPDRFDASASWSSRSLPKSPSPVFWPRWPQMPLTCSSSSSPPPFLIERVPLCCREKTIFLRNPKRTIKAKFAAGWSQSLCMGPKQPRAV